MLALATAEGQLTGGILVQAARPVGAGTTFAVCEDATHFTQLIVGVAMKRSNRHENVPMRLDIKKPHLSVELWVLLETSLWCS